MKNNKKSNIKKEYLCTIALIKSGDGFAVSSELKKDIFIPQNKTKGAFHGDTVWVTIQNEKRSEGKVERIEERAKTEFVGAIHQNKKEIWFVPKDPKVPSNFLINKKSSSRFSGKFKDGDIVLIRVTNWGDEKRMPTGDIVRIIGKAGKNDTEMESIAEEHGFRTKHEKIVEAESLKINEAGISDGDIRNRRDFRGIATFTIDPEDARDFDDAISIRPIENEFHEIGVHIADVSHYVKPGTALDKEAYKRATSVYLVDRVIPMLPEILSNNLCSLLPNRDRLTFSAVFIIDARGKIHDEWFGKTVIHSNKRFTYEDVQKIIETENGEYKNEILTLNNIAKNIRRKRFEKGSVSLDSVEVKFKFDGNGKPVEIYKKIQKDAHKLVEEFMLLANKKVAEKIFKRGNDRGKIFVYRNHDLPDSDKIEDLKEILVNFGYNIKSKGTGFGSKELNDIIEQFEGREERSLVMWIILRSMAKAVYSTENIGHFGLAFDSYTHFTSPIRRYPDIMVHRLLNDHLSGIEIKKEKKEYEKICNHCSEMERKAMNAERESIKFKQVEFVTDKIGQIFAGIITGITDWGIYVEAEEILCEGMVSVRDMNDDYYVADKKGISMAGEKTGKKYSIGDKVRIKLVSTDLKRRTMDFQLV